MRRPDIPILTTLRFPAALAIVFYHFLPYTKCPEWVWQGLSAGVSFFYVLSGFILYYNYADLPDRRFFWVARFARIWPMHLFCLALVFCMLPFDWLDGHASWPITLPANILLLQAWLPFQGSGLSYNGVSWSLSVEAFFYLCFPWLLKFMNARGPWLPLLLSFVLGLVLVVTAELISPARAQFVWPFNPAMRLFEFVLGMTACHFWLAAPASSRALMRWTGIELSWLAIALAAVVGIPVAVHELDTVAQVRGVTVTWFSAEICALVFAGLIWIFACQAGMVSRIFSSRPYEWLGEISFALYMSHQIILRWLDPKPIHDVWGATGFFLPYLAACMILAAALFHLVETPARHAIVTAWKRRAK